METKHKHQFGKKRETAHEKGKCPTHALTKRRGKVSVKYIEDKGKRLQTRNRRKNGLFKKALEYATMTGDSTRLEIRDEYFDAQEDGLVTEQTSSDATSTEKQPTPDVPLPSCSDVALSPKAVKAVKAVKAQSKDVEIQCALVENVGNHLGNEQFCRVCGGLYDNDSRQEQKLWIGCTEAECKYWLHVKCLLGKSKKITPKFCHDMPYLCPFHRK